MRSLLVLRHAKSSWKYENLTDHERPLNRRGQRDAPRMGRWILEHDLVPDHILTSSAVRAQTTARLCATSMEYDGAVEIREDLYLAGVRVYLDVLRKLSDEVTRAMVVGHNPDAENLLATLAGADHVMPTAALAVVELPLDSWNDLRQNAGGKLVHLITPKNLPD